MQIMKDDGSCRVLLKGENAKKYGCSILYVKHVTVRLLKQAECCGKDENMFRAERRNALSGVIFESMSTEYIRAC